MTRTPTILAILAALVLAGTLAAPARADDDCFVPMADWQPSDAVLQAAAQMGWTVERLKIDDGCYQIRGTDRDGRRIKATLHPATLAVIEIEYKDNTDRARRSRDKQKGHDDE